MIFVEITAIKLLPNVREFNDVFSELSVVWWDEAGGAALTRNPVRQRPRPEILHHSTLPFRQ